MIELIKGLLAALFVDGTPEERARTVRVGFRIVLVAYIVWGLGGLANFGLGGFARADSVSKLAEEKEAKFSSALLSITARLDRQEDVLRQIRLDQLGAKLRELHRVCCSTPITDELGHARMVSEIDEAQREYKALAGERYPLPKGCEQ